MIVHEDHILQLLITVIARATRTKKKPQNENYGNYNIIL